jgi:homoserine dehydrogenase
LIDPAETLTRYYLRMAAKDIPGVIAKISKALGDHHISISAMVQHENNEGAFVPLVITTHRTREGDVQRAADAIAALDVVRGRPVCIRVVDLPRD